MLNHEKKKKKEKVYRMKQNWRAPAMQVVLEERKRGMREQVSKIRW